MLSDLRYIGYDIPDDVPDDIPDDIPDELALLRIISNNKIYSLEKYKAFEKEVIDNNN